MTFIIIIGLHYVYYSTLMDNEIMYDKEFAILLN